MALPVSRTSTLTTPIRTPLAFAGGELPWAVETPSPSFLAKQLSDPFQLRRTAEAAAVVPTPQRADRRRAMLQMAAQASLGSMCRTASGKSVVAARTTMITQDRQTSFRSSTRRSPSDAPTLLTARSAAAPRGTSRAAVSRQWIRQICLPFFEEMLDAVEATMVQSRPAPMDASKSKEPAKASPAPVAVATAPALCKHEAAPAAAAVGDSAQPEYPFMAPALCKHGATPAAAVGDCTQPDMEEYPFMAPALSKHEAAPAAAAAAVGDCAQPDMEEYPFMEPSDSMISRRVQEPMTELPLRRRICSDDSRSEAQADAQLEASECQCSEGESSSAGASGGEALEVQQPQWLEQTTAESLASPMPGASTPQDQLLDCDGATVTNQRVKRGSKARGCRGGRATRLSRLAAAVAPGQPQVAAAGRSSTVCRHWQTKGWCKYEDLCKFAHPAHCRGIGEAPKGSEPSDHEASELGVAPLVAQPQQQRQPQQQQPCGMLFPTAGCHMACVAVLPTGPWPCPVAPQFGTRAAFGHSYTSFAP